MRVLVTGGAGFIGSRVAEELRLAGHEAVTLDAYLPQAHPGQGPREGVDVVADVRDGDAVERALRGVDAVCHQAAMVGLGSAGFLDAPDYVGCNDLGTAVLLAAMARAGVRDVVMAGSMVVYGEGRYTCPEHGDVRPGPRAEADLAAGVFDPPCPRCGAALVPGLVGEEAPTDPRNVYATTKLAQEHLCASWARAVGGRAVSLRYHNVYGPGMPRDTPYAGVASFFRSALARGEAPRVFEDGRQRRDFVHVADVARANVAALEAVRDRAGAGAVRLQHRKRDAAHHRRDGAGAGGRVRGPGAPDHRRVQAGRRTAHHRVLPAAGRGAVLAAEGGLRRGDGRVRRRRPARIGRRGGHDGVRTTPPRVAHVVHARQGHRFVT
ncbi:NAD-dependent epimerase/dehydratase family protein [Nocardiopsis sp. ARC36]